MANNFEQLGFKEDKPSDDFKSLGFVAEPSQAPQPSLLSRIASNPVVNFLNEASKSAQQSVADFATGTLNLEPRLANLALKKAGINFQLPTVPRAKLDEDTTNPVAQLTGALASGAFIPLPGARAETALGRVLKTSGLGAGIGAAFAAAKPHGNIGTGAAIGALLGTGAQGTQEAIEAPLLSLIKRGRIPGSPVRSPEEVAQLSKHLGDIPVSLGDITNSPSLRMLFNTALRSVPFTGVAKKSERGLAATQNIANNLMEHFRSDVPPEDIQDSLGSSLRQNTEKQERIKNLLYSGVNEDAQEAGFDLGKSDNIIKKAKEFLSQDRDLRNKKLLPKIGSKDRDILNQIVARKSIPGKRLSAILDQKGNPLELQAKETQPVISFNDAIGQSSKLGELQRQSANFDNKFVSSMYGQLDSALHDDISNAVKKTNDPILMDKWINAKEHFKENVLPTRESQIVRLLNNKQGIENIQNALVKTKFDSVLNNLTPKGRRLVGHQLLQKAFQQTPTGETVVSAPKLFGTWNRLSPNIKEKLFTNEENEMFRRLGAHVQVTKESRIQQELPATGARVVPAQIKAALGGGLAALGATTGVLPAAAGLATLSGGGRLLTNLLTSPRLRNAFIRGNLLPRGAAQRLTLQSLLLNKSRQRGNQQ